MLLQMVFGNSPEKISLVIFIPTLKPNALGLLAVLKCTDPSPHIVNAARNIYSLERGSSVVERRPRNQVSPGSNPRLLSSRSLCIFVLSMTQQFTQLYK